MATLYRIGSNGETAQRWDLERGSVIIGRSTLANIHIEDESMSRKHLLIFREGDDFFVRDLNSRNGTWIGDERVSTFLLQSHDSFRAGSTLFVFKHEPAPSRSGPHGTVVLTAAT